LHIETKKLFLATAVDGSDVSWSERQAYMLDLGPTSCLSLSTFVVNTCSVII